NELLLSRRKVCQPIRLFGGAADTHRLREATRVNAPNHDSRQVTRQRLAGQFQVDAQFFIEDPKYVPHTLRATDRQSPEWRAPIGHERSAQGKGFDGIRSAPKPAVDNDWHATLHHIDDLSQRIDGRPSIVKLTPAV